MNRKILTFILLLVTLALGAGAVYVGIQLQDQPDVTPSDVDASDAQCCQNALGACGNSCGGSSPGAACASSNNWCWCAQITNGCVPDGGGAPEGTSETMCGYGTYNGSVCYTCPVGWHGAGVVVCSGASAQDCGNCNQPTPTPTQPTPTPTQSTPTPTQPTPTPTQPTPTPTQPTPTPTQPTPTQPTPTPTQPTPTPTGPTSTPSPTPTFIGSECGDTCSTSAGDSACPQDHQCIDNNGDGTGVCQLNQCVTQPNSCYSDGCTPVPDCAEPCDPSEGDNACSQDHQCSDPDGDGTGTCILDECAADPDLCLPDQCTPIGEVPDCGEVCDPNQGGNACPNDHQCTDPDGDGTYRCILNQCVTDPGSCTDNQCTPELPATALISDEIDRLVLAVALVFLGGMAYRFGAYIKIGRVIEEKLLLPFFPDLFVEERVSEFEAKLIDKGSEVD